MYNYSEPNSPEKNTKNHENDRLKYDIDDQRKSNKKNNDNDYNDKNSNGDQTKNKNFCYRDGPGSPLLGEYFVSENNGNKQNNKNVENKYDNFEKKFDNILQKSAENVRRKYY